MKHRKIVGFLLIMVMAQMVSAETIEGLLSAGKLEARALVATPAPHYRKAPVEIVIEVGTPDRFNGSIRVRDFTVPTTLVRRMSKTAKNETRRREGVSWKFQTWRYQVHAEHEGTLGFPELTTFISVETEAHGEVKGALKLTVPAIQIVPAPGTEGLDSWVAATAFDVEESWESEQESYEVGDAVTRVRKFTIKGAPAMAIPESARIDFDGIYVYQAPALVDDQEVGGALQGTREERVVFTFKGGGSFTIPEEQIHWFNLQSQSVERIDFAERILQVSGPPVSADRSADAAPRNAATWWYAGLAALLMVSAYLLARRTHGSLRIAQVRESLQAARRKRQDRAAFMQAAEAQNSHRCLELLYQQMAELSSWELRAACQHDPRMLAASEALMAHAFGSGKVPEPSEVKFLWQLSKAPKTQQRESNKLELNPGCSE
ncbi:BatD family protein [Rubritalea marina]|uniref:BatD family protein n=1 Tax=Rubritalea marina TaxID=361055 RepID=UPI000399D033|nr:BatD family protein [Rubritalea marina]